MSHCTLLPENWPRMAHFCRFLDNPCTSTVTARVDITTLAEFVKDRGLSLTGTLTWCAAYVVNGREEFRLTLSGGEPAVWDTVHPAYNLFHEEDETYTSLFTLYDPDPAVFLSRMEEDTARARSLRVPVIPSPMNTFEVSALPWLGYDSVSVSMAYPPLSPMIVWGQYQPSPDGRLLLPLTMQIHHAAADGFHISRFFREFTEICGRFRELYP